MKGGDAIKTTAAERKICRKETKGNAKIEIHPNAETKKRKKKEISLERTEYIHNEQNIEEGERTT